jgi:hypothetical protein
MGVAIRRGVVAEDLDEYFHGKLRYGGAFVLFAAKVHYQGLSRGKSSIYRVVNLSAFDIRVVVLYGDVLLQSTSPSAKIVATKRCMASVPSLS